VAYCYRPKDPRGKLREVVTKYTGSMRTAGHAPNRGVVFGDGDSPGARPQAQGWLLGDRRPGAGGDQYLLMEDGDVWRATKPEGASPALDAAVAAWLAEPNDDLVMILARSLSDARLGGTGWLEDGDGVEHVDDRRTARAPHGGPDRRRGS
jgi:hypothetical protein